MFLDRIKSLIGMVRAWLRSTGLFELADLNESDMLYLIGQSRACVKGPACAGAGWNGRFGSAPADGFIPPGSSKTPAKKHHRRRHRAPDNEQQRASRSRRPEEGSVRNFWRWFSDSREGSTKKAGRWWCITALTLTCQRDWLRRKIRSTTSGFSGSGLLYRPSNIASS